MVCWRYCYSRKRVRRISGDLRRAGGAGGWNKLYSSCSKPKIILQLHTFLPSFLPPNTVDGRVRFRPRSRVA
jgi:hypothetical protein